MDAYDAQAVEARWQARWASEHAYEVARAAFDRGADDEGLTFCRAAARGGSRQATLELARTLLAGVDPEAALLLGVLGTEPAAGRHRHRATCD